MSVFTVSAWAASTVNSAGYEAYRAGDGYALIDAGYRWASTSSGVPQWLRADLGTSQAATWYTVSPAFFGSQEPTAWTFEGTNDGTFASWTTLDTKTAQAFGNNETNTYTFTNATAYRYYRLNMTAGAASIVSVSELVIGDGTPPSRLWGWGPFGGSSSGDYTLAVEFYPTSDGNITHLSYYELSAQTGTITLRVRDGSGTALVTTTDTMVSGRFGWREVALGSPLAITSGTHYEVERYANSSFVTMSYGPTAGARTYVDLVMVANGSGTVRGKTMNPRYASGDTLTNAYAGQYAVGVVFSRSSVTTTTGTIAGASPVGVGAIVGTVPTTGTLAGTSPSGVGSLVGSAPTTGTIAGTSPSGVGSLVGDVPNFDVSGNVAGTSPSGTGSIVGTAPTTGALAGASPSGVCSLAGVVPDAITGTIAGTSPSGVGSLVGVVTLPGVVTGTVAGSGPRAAGSISGIVGDPTIESATVSLTHTPVGILSVIPLLPSTELDHAVPVTRTSILAPVLSAEYPAHPSQGEAGAPVTIDGIVGHVHLWIDGQDVTYWRGGITEIKRWESEAPFGDTVAAFSFPQKQPWDVDGEGDLSFLREDAPVAIGIVETTEGEGFTVTRVRRLWSGFLDAQGSGLGDGEFYDYEAKGTLWQAQSNNREPHAITEPVDIGVWIARVLNAVDGRRWATMPLVPIGITTTTRGSRDDMAMEYVQALLTEAITDDLRQWTLLEVAPGIIRLVLKPAPSTVHATVAYGTPGVDISLRVDQSTRVDRVFMRGIGPKAGGWANVFYPGLETLTAPPYPMAGFASITLGTSDSDTTSGSGVTDWQRRVDELRGFANPPVSGVMSSAWVAVIDDLQRRVGVTADGSLGPQTWNATFDRAISGVDLTPRRLAMASKPEAEKYLYTATGVRLPGVNPAWDGRIPRDVGIDAGPGKSKAQGFKLARKILGLYGTAAASGTIDWITDPNETDRTTLSHLSNIKVLGFQGRDVVVQVASKVVELDGDSDGKQYVVTTRVDERARDATAVEDLLEQRRNAQADPSRNPLARNRASRQVSDQRTPWDSESPCGVLRRTAVNGASGLWSVVTIPFAEVGKLAGIRLSSTRPFAFAIFASQRITENKLAAIVGNPFSSSDPWRDEKGQLDEYGIIEAWGEQGNACGYSPKTETDDGAPFTGDFILDTPVDYWTETVPYVSVAIFMRGGSGWISGQFIPAYES